MSVWSERARALARERERLEAREVRLRLVNPACPERGYALLSGPDGQTLRSINDAPKGLSSRRAWRMVTRVDSEGPDEPEQFMSDNQDMTYGRPHALDHILRSIEGGQGTL